MIASGGVGNAWPTSRLSHAKTHWQPDRRAPCVCSSWIEELASSIRVLEVPLAPMSFCGSLRLFNGIVFAFVDWDLLMTTSPRISFASLNAYETSLVMYLQQVMSQRLNSLKSSVSWILDAQASVRIYVLRQYGGTGRWRCAKHRRVGGTGTHQSVIGGLWNLGLAVGTLKNIHWRPPVHIRDGFVAVDPISLAFTSRLMEKLRT